MPLNPQQQQVVDHVDGPCLVTAVPGSGKTTAITERTKNLVLKGVDPASILSITFTNKAADEMKARIAKAVGDRARRMLICTFHSLCARVIRENCEAVGLRPGFTIYDSDESKRLMKSCIARVEGEKFKPTDDYLDALMAYIEGRRDGCLTHEQAADKYGVQGSQVKVISSYFQEMKRANAIDFTGLIHETNKLFESRPEIKARYNARWRYVAVDEVQDTNVAQYRLISHLAAAHGNVVVVGDLDQSVYRFRNATPENILAFEKDFGAKVIKLETNYRSTPEILAPSQALIEKNRLRKRTVLRTDNGPGEKPRIVFAPTEDRMASALATEVERRLADGVAPREIAVLYRTNYVSRILEMKLRAAEVPYKVVGGHSFWNRKEVRWSIGILKLLANPKDRLAFEVAVEACCRGIGHKRVHEIIDNASNRKIDLVESARMFCDSDGAAAKGLGLLVNNIRKTDKPSDTLRGLLDTSAFGVKIAKESTTDNDRRANVMEVAQDVDTHIAEGGDTGSYLQSISLLTGDDDQTEEGRVRLMTMHGCKGLEFEVVLISHALDGVIPHSRTLALADEDPAEFAAQMEEERRLMYVAMTRAKKVLKIYLCGMRGTTKVSASRFLFETGIQAFKV